MKNRTGRKRGPSCQIEWLFARTGSSAGVAPQLNKHCRLCNPLERLGSTKAISQVSFKPLNDSSLRPPTFKLRLSWRGFLFVRARARPGGLPSPRCPRATPRVLNEVCQKYLAPKIPNAQGFDQRRQGPLPRSPASRDALIALSNILPRNHGPIAGTTLEPP